MYAGFPLGPFHVLIALEMFVIVIIFARLHKAGRNVAEVDVFHHRKWFACTAAVLFPDITGIFPSAQLPSILLATVVNAVVAAVVIPALRHVVDGRMGVLR